MSQAQVQKVLGVNLDGNGVVQCINGRIAEIQDQLEPQPDTVHSQVLNVLAAAPGAMGLFASVHEQTAFIQRHASTWRSLEPIYTWHEWKSRVPAAKYHLMAFLFEGAAGRAVRNRRAIVREVEIACAEVLNSGSVDILSIGGGAGPAIREMMGMVPFGGRVVVLDRDQVPHAQPEWLQSLPASWEYEVRRADAREVFTVLNGLRPQIVEKVGVGDYLPDEKLAGMLRLIHQAMPGGSWLITGNVDSGFVERPFVHQMVGWPQMYYRSQQELLELIYAGGFDISRSILVQEPCGFFNLIAAPK